MTVENVSNQERVEANKESPRQLAEQKFNAILDRVQRLNKWMNKNSEFKILGSGGLGSKDIAIIKKEGEVTTVQVLSMTGIWKFKLMVYQVRNVQVNERFEHDTIIRRPDGTIQSFRAGTLKPKKLNDGAIGLSVSTGPYGAGVSYWWDKPFISHNKIGVRVIPGTGITIPIISIKKRKEGETVTQRFWDADAWLNVDLEYDKLLSKDKLTPEQVLNDYLPSFEKELEESENIQRWLELEQLREEEKVDAEADENRVREIEELFENGDDSNPE